MDTATTLAVEFIILMFALVAIEHVHAIRRQNQREHYASLDRAADRCREARHRAARAAENLLTVDHHAGPESPATVLASRTWIEAAYAAPAADPGTIRKQNRSL